MQTAPDFSICVATRNRKALLPGLVAALERQAGASLELIVVVDGDIDGSAEVLAALAAQSALPLKWEAIAHSGRGAALNRCFDLASGRFLFLLDDDDTLPPGALADIAATWESIAPEERDGFCGVCGLAEDQNGKLIGTAFPRDPTDSDFFTLRQITGIRGDKREVVLRERVGSWRFPVFAGEARVATNLLWFHLAARYRARFVNRVWLTKTYQPDGLTAHGLRNKVRSARSTAHYNETALRLFPRMPLWLKLRFGRDYARYARHAGISVSDRRAVLRSTPFGPVCDFLGGLAVRRDVARLAKGG